MTYYLNKNILAYIKVISIIFQILSFIFKTLSFYLSVQCSPYDTVRRTVFIVHYTLYAVRRTVSRTLYAILYVRCSLSINIVLINLRVHFVQHTTVRRTPSDVQWYYINGIMHKAVYIIYYTT